MLKMLLAGALALVSFAAVAAPAEVLPRAASPEEVGLSSVQLGRLSSVTRDHVEHGRLPGAVLLVARHGKIAWFEAIGSRDKAASAPMTTDTIFRLYSMTKPITSVAIMMLVEEGKLQVYDPVGKYIPELAKMKVGTEKPGLDGKPVLELADPPRQITVQDLLRHSSGFTYGARGQTLVHEQYRQAKIGDRGDSLSELVTKLSNIPLLYPPGTRFEYGVSTDVLGRVVEVISGKPFGEFLEERIFKPLGMTETAFVVPQDKVARAAQPWQRPDGPQMTARFDVAQKARYESGGGGLTGTPLDYLRFTTMLLNGGEYDGARILGKKTIEYMTADHLDKMHVATPGLGFGLGFQVRRATGVAGIAGTTDEYGWAGNAGTIFWIDPKEKLIAIYMIQVSDGERVELRNQFRSMVQASIIR